MELNGTFKDSELSKLLQYLNFDKATGVLTLGHKRDQITISMQNGDIVDVDHSEESKYDRMGTILVNSSRSTEKEFAIILQERVTRQVSMGVVLRKYGVLSAEKYQDLVKMVVGDILMEALKWQEGTYTFVHTDNVQLFEMAKPIPTQMFLVNAVRQDDSWVQIKKYVPVMDVIFSPSPKHVAQGKWASIVESLPPKYRGIAEHINGKNTVVMISEKSLQPLFEVSRLLAELARRGLVVKAEEGGVPDTDRWPSGFFRMQTDPLPTIIVAAVLFILLIFFACNQFYYQSAPAENPAVETESATDSETATEPSDNSGAESEAVSPEEQEEGN